MLVDFQDCMDRRGCVAYDDISSVREDNQGFGVLRLKTGETIVTNMIYTELKTAYNDALEEDLAMLLDDTEDDEGYDGSV